MAPGVVLQEWVSLADIYPTILDMAGSDYDASAVHGKSFLPLLKGQEAAESLCFRLRRNMYHRSRMGA